MAHRLSWFYQHGRWPETDVRPIDGNYDHCWIANLKEVSRVELAHQRAKNKNNTTGYLGVSPSRFGKFQASITWNRRQISLGSNFDTPEEASAVYVATDAALKAAKTQSEIDLIIRNIKLQRRQRAAWANLVAQKIPLGWSSFDAFAKDITESPKLRYAMMPMDASKPIGPGNYKWASAGHEISSSADRIAYNRANREANHDHYRNKDFQRNYGINFGEYQRILNAKGGVCAICGKPETKIEKGTLRLLSVDHDHTTGGVRGLLCANCNLGLGYFRDSSDTLLNAIAYLNRYNR
jgi:hypothetical protein